MTREEVIEIRHRLGYSQQELGALVGYSIGTIRRMEKGTIEVPTPISIILGYILKYEVGPYAEMIRAMDNHVKSLVESETHLMKTQLEVIRRRFKRMDNQSLNEEDESSSLPV